MNSLLLSLLLSSLSLADFYDFYGEVRFQKRLEDKNEDDGRKNTKVVTWSGSTRYLPGEIAVVTANYRSESISEKRVSGTHPCSWKDEPAHFHDYDYQRVLTTLTVNRPSPNYRLEIFIEDDGSYKARAAAWGGESVPNATRLFSRRETFEGCSNPPLSVLEQKTEAPGSMESLSFENITGIMDPATKRLKGDWHGTDEDGGDLYYAWDLTMAAPEITARIAPAGPVTRADVVILDAAPSTGPIKNYSWEFTPLDDCAFGPGAAGLKMEGKKVSFPALCSFTAQLTVSNEKNSATSSVDVLVTPRDPARWKTAFQTRVGPTFRAPIFADQIHFGVNNCALHQGEQTTGHMIHTDAENNRTWRGAGYKLTQVSANGPFQGAWYVESQTLRVDRLERVNANLLDGEVFQLNKRKNNLSDLNAVVDQVKKHESTHSVLVQEALRQLGTEHDPAWELEKVVGSEEDATQFMADFKVREAETIFQEASAEENVHDRLRAMGLNREVKLWVPSRPDTPGGPQGEFLKNLGPLWNIGH